MTWIRVAPLLLYCLWLLQVPVTLSAQKSWWDREREARVPITVEVRGGLLAKRPVIMRWGDLAETLGDGRGTATPGAIADGPVRRRADGRRLVTTALPRSGRHWLNVIEAIERYAQFEDKEEERLRLLDFPGVRPGVRGQVL